MSISHRYPEITSLGLLPFQPPSFKPKVLVHSVAILSKPRQVNSWPTLPSKVRLDMYILQTGVPMKHSGRFLKLPIFTPGWEWGDDKVMKGQGVPSCHKTLPPHCHLRRETICLYNIALYSTYSSHSLFWTKKNDFSFPASVWRVVYHQQS